MVQVAEKCTCLMKNILNQSDKIICCFKMVYLKSHRLTFFIYEILNLGSNFFNYEDNLYN